MVIAVMYYLKDQPAKCKIPTENSFAPLLFGAGLVVATALPHSEEVAYAKPMKMLHASSRIRAHGSSAHSTGLSKTSLAMPPRVGPLHTSRRQASLHCQPSILPATHAGLPETEKLIHNDSLFPGQNRTQAMRLEAGTGHINAHEDSVLAPKMGRPRYMGR